MIVNRRHLLALAPIKDMLDHKDRHGGVSHGLSEAGYDIRIRQRVSFSGVSRATGERAVLVDDEWSWGNFALASAVEEFIMPQKLTGIVHDKSTWARRGLSVFNTVIEPGWKGFLTLELVYHGQEPLQIPAGAGIAQVVFHETSSAARYQGKYQHQPDRPVRAIAS